MMGKRPLHVSSDFLGETLAAIAVKSDGNRRYSYKSLVNPDLSKVRSCFESEKKHVIFCEHLPAFPTVMFNKVEVIMTIIHIKP